jgi:hypothetical protein
MAATFRSRLVAREPLYGTARRYREAGCTLITTAVDATAVARDTAAQFSLARA